LCASIIIFIPVTLITSIWTGSGPYLIPIALMSLGMALFHVVMRVRVESANPHLIRKNYHLALAGFWGILLTMNLLVSIDASSFLDRKLVVLYIIEGSLLFSHIYKWKKKRT